MSLQNTITKVIAVLRAAITPAGDYTLCKGIYEGDQMSYSRYPVICVGVPSILDENFPVIARQSIRDEFHAVEIVAYVKYADSALNARQLVTLTDSIRAALREDIKAAAGPLGGGSYYQGAVETSNFVFGAKGDILLRVSVTIVKYIERI